MGRYVLKNLPAGVYDVWAAPEKPADAAAAQEFNRGLAALAVAAGAEPIAAPDLVVGPGGLLRVQLIDASTGQPVALPGGGSAQLAVQKVGGPRMQDEPQPRVPVAADGTFEVRLTPGTFRLAMFVYQGEQRPGAGGPVYQTSDDIHSVGATITLAHGDEADAELKIWPIADINAMREATVAANNLRYDSDKKPEALRQSIAAYTTLLARYPDSHNALLGRGSAHEELGNYAEAIADYERILAAYPGDGNGTLFFARLLATCPEAEFRDGPRAVELATQLVKLMEEQGWIRAEYLAILASAQAEAGDFASAVATQKQAVDMATDDNRAAMRERLQLFEAGKPYHREAVKLP
jgi:tetratricopeptide (TPR) repeat protein